MPNSSRRPEVFIAEAEAKSALPVAESFARRGFRVVAGSSRRYCAAAYSRAVRQRVHMPNEVMYPDECLAFLLDLCRRRRFEMIVPLGDVVTELVCRRRDEFMAYSKLAVVPYDTFRIGRDKIETMKAARKCGIPLPRTWYPQDQALEEIAELVEYPVLVKPAIATGARGITFVRTRAELAPAYHRVSRSFGRAFVQEHVPHQGMQYKVDLIMDRDGTLLAGVVYNKIRFYPASGGSSVLNETVARPDILEYATRIARYIGWYGLCDFDFIHDIRDNTTKIMEINPRFPESFRMCQAAGVDFPHILYQMACGKKVEPALDYELGRRLRFLPGDLLWFLTVGKRRWNALPGFLSFLDPKTTYQIVSLRDPGPIMGYLLESAAMFLDPRERAFRFRLDAAREGRNA